jgi:hypothetical protein
MTKKDFKESLRIVRKENKYKKPTKSMLTEAAKRYLDREDNQKKMRDLLNGIGN